jgi:tetratricopeptide (TPR) repeat protein
MVRTFQICTGNVLTLIAPDALALARKLDGLPLALATAGAYLDQVSTSFSEYLRLFENSWLKLLESSPDLDSYDDHALHTTWNLSFDHVSKQNILSAKLLQLWAYFDNQDIWFELLQHADSSSLAWFSNLVKDEVGFTAAMRMLCDHGLVEAEKSSEERIEAAGYSMHGCVHSWTINVLNREWDDEMAELALECVGAHVPEQNAQKGWLTERRMLRHAFRCLDMVDKGLLNSSSQNSALHELGRLYFDQGKLKEAEKMYQWALQGFEMSGGPDHTSTLVTVNSLGVLYANLGRPEEAEKLYQRALQGFEKIRGPEHISTLDTINNLGMLYTDLGRLEEAEKMYQRALFGKEKAWGPEDLSTLYTVNNLGNLYFNQGKLEKAEKMYQRALLGKEKAWGPEHISTLDTVNNFGNLYKSLGGLKEAEKMYQRALLGKEKAWGPEHTLTLDTVNNLGLLYADLGRLKEAEQMYQRALQGYEKIQGPEHTSTLNTVNNLGLLYVDLGRLEEAEKLYQRALLRKEKAWGPEHSSTLDTVNNLGYLYFNQGKLEKAEKMYQRALQGFEKAWGPEHTSTLVTVNNLGALYRKRSYTAAKAASRSIVLAYVKQLSGLCIKFPSSRLTLLDCIGRSFAWMGDNEKAAATFAHQLALSPPGHTANCDGCRNRLNLKTSRLVCKTCEDRDFCRSCFEKFGSNELIEVVSSCQSHIFLEIDDSSIVNSSSTNNVDPCASIEQWLKDIADIRENN